MKIKMLYKIFSKDISNEGRLVRDELCVGLSMVMMARSGCENCQATLPEVYKLSKAVKMKIGIIEDEKDFEDRVFNHDLFKIDGKAISVKTFPIFLIFEHGVLKKVYEGKFEQEELLLMAQMAK